MIKSDKLIANLEYLDNISNKREKKILAEKILSNVKDGDVIGVGSGTTSLIALQMINEKIQNENISIKVIPTSLEISFMCCSFGIPITNLTSNRPDWIFDGADEVDESLNLIKGRGGAMFKEKLLFHSTDKIFVLVDKSKLVKKLCSNFPIPVEIFPNSVVYVEEQLKNLGAYKQLLRNGKGKDGPTITENGNLIIDAWFDNITEYLEKDIKLITGVVESGLFLNYKFDLLLP